MKVKDARDKEASASTSASASASTSTSAAVNELLTNVLGVSQGSGDDEGQAFLSNMLSSIIELTSNQGIPVATTSTSVFGTSHTNSASYAGDESDEPILEEQD